MSKRISRGEVVLIKNKLTLIFLMMKMAQYNKDTIPDFLNNIHLSRHGSLYLPYFIPSFRSADHSYYQDLSLM